MADQEYETLANIFKQLPNLISIKMFIQDNYIHPAKAKFIEDAVLALPVQRFTFSNCVLGLDVMND